MHDAIIYAGYVLFPSFVFAVFAYCKCKEENQVVAPAHGRPQPTATAIEPSPPIESGIISQMESQEAITFAADFGENEIMPMAEVSCSICLIDYQHGETIQRNAFNESSITCNHIFHPECIATWIERSRKSECPCCRNPFG
jgi:hypothetical protein